MTSNKHIIYIYKITTQDDKLKLFIGSTKEKLSTLMFFYIKNCNSNQQNILYDWIRPLNKSNLKIKLIKSYPVSNKNEQKNREEYWINKYKKYGFFVIHTPLKNKSTVNNEKLSKIYVCIEGVTMKQIINTYGDNIVYISKDNFSNTCEKSLISSTCDNMKKHETKHETKNETKHKTKNANIVIHKKTNSLQVVQNAVNDEGYLNELKNVLSKRKNLKLSVNEIVNKNTRNNNKTMKSNKPQIIDNYIDELKQKIKRFE